MRHMYGKINDIETVASIMQYDLEYENMLMCLER